MTDRPPALPASCSSHSPTTAYAGPPHRRRRQAPELLGELLVFEPWRGPYTHGQGYLGRCIGYILGGQGRAEPRAPVPRRSQDRVDHVYSLQWGISQSWAWEDMLFITHRMLTAVALGLGGTYWNYFFLNYISEAVAIVTNAEQGCECANGRGSSKTTNCQKAPSWREGRLVFYRDYGCNVDHILSEKRSIVQWFVWQRVSQLRPCESYISYQI